MGENKSDKNSTEGAPKKANFSKEILGNKFAIEGQETDGSTSGIKGSITGPSDSYLINLAVTKSENGFQINGSGGFIKEPLEGKLNASVSTNEYFIPELSSLKIDGSAKISKEISGLSIDLNGTMENGSLAGLSGTVKGPNGAYVINTKVESNGDTYLISGDGAFVKGPIEGSIKAQIEADKSFAIDPSTLNIGGEVGFEKEIVGVKVNLAGTMEKGALSSLKGTITGPNNSFEINASIIDNGETYAITGSGAFLMGPLDGTLEAEIEADKSLNFDTSSLNIGGSLSMKEEVLGNQVDLAGELSKGKLSRLLGTVEGPNQLYNLNVSVIDNEESYTISGSGDFKAGPVEGVLNAEIEADSSLNIDPSSFNVGGQASVETEVSGFKINLSGAVEEGSLKSLQGIVEGPNGAFLINVSVEQNGDIYTIVGSGTYAVGPVKGNLSAKINTGPGFSIDPSSLDISGDATVDTSFMDMIINLTGVVEEGSLKSLVGKIIGPNDFFTLDASIEDIGELYKVIGSGAFTVGPVDGNITGEFMTDKKFIPDLSTVSISGDATVDTEIADNKIKASGTVEDGSLKNLEGTFVGPDDLYSLTVSVNDNGDGYTVNGSGPFSVGPITGTLEGEIQTDKSFVPDPSTLQIGGKANVETEIAGNQIEMEGQMHNGSLQSLTGSIQGPNGMYLLNASVVDNGAGYTVTGSGPFSLGPIDGTVEGKIQTDKKFIPDLSSLEIGGEAKVSTELAGNKIDMSGAMHNGSLQSLIGTIEGPNGLYLLSVSVVENGEGYTITGGGAFEMGPVVGELTGEIETDPNFSPFIDTLTVGGEATVNTELAGHKIIMKGTMVKGSLQSLSGTIEGPNGLYVLSASVVDNGNGYTISGEGGLSKGPIEGSVNGTINTDENFSPDFSSMKLGGSATINTEVAGNKVSGSATVKNGYLESISATVEGPGGLYNLNAKGKREGDKGYDIEAGAAFTILDKHFAIEPPPILLPVGVPGVFVEISSEIGFGAKASADIVTGFKTNPHFIPDFSTFEIRSASLIGHGEVSISIFGGISVGLPFAKVSAGIEAELKGVIDAILTLSADPTGLKVSGSMYGALLGALYAAVKLKFLWSSKKFRHLIVEGNVASVEKEFGPTDFSLMNILEGFKFGTKDISIPGKAKTASLPKPEEESPESKKEIEDGKKEEEEKDNEEDPKEEKSDDDPGDTPKGNPASTPAPSTAAPNLSRSHGGGPTVKRSRRQKQNLNTDKKTAQSPAARLQKAANNSPRAAHLAALEEKANSKSNNRVSRLQNKANESGKGERHLRTHGLNKEDVRSRSKEKTRVPDQITEEKENKLMKEK